MSKIKIYTKVNFHYSILLLLLVISFLLSFPEFAIAKGGGGSTSSGIGTGFGKESGSQESGGGDSNGGNNNNNIDPFFNYVNVPMSLSYLCLLCYKKHKKKNNTNLFNQNMINNKESGTNHIININDNNSLPPSYESTNPAPDPPYEFGKKHEATNNSFREAEKFSIQHPPTENLPKPEEIENIIIQDGYKAWKFIIEDIVAKRATISNDGRTVELCKRKRGFKYDDMMIQTNFPFFIPDIHSVDSEEVELEILHYFEITILSKLSNGSTVAIGISTKPYPYFRLPGWNKNSVGYHSDDGRKFWNDEFGGRDYGPEWGKLGDVIGCGYKPNTDIYGIRLLVQMGMLR
ncbi:concanavalin A-like lectin/glucanase domain-containing protein [Rhizophagus clarus]|uniref:Concanavalin A-like lectin/glucanase domain-containing protein n=1 Tax=Rhizophagus clarus TaxID=94130 RepID=A0A8H3KXK0_9GLOM|nr:concanavalin A-like lectin/glucanase domain-containing protein [Rhizophagus clarus]